MVEQLNLEQYQYNEDYPYLQGLVENTRNLKHRVRVAAREYARVYFPLGLKPGDKLLDVGSCIGILGHYLKYGGIHTYGLDLNHSAILMGKELFGNEKKNVSVVADAASIPYPSGVFDAVVSQDVFEHLNNEYHACEALREMTRVLDPNKNLMFHKVTVLEDREHIDADESHKLKWPTIHWINFFESQGWNVIDNPTRHFPIASKVSHGNFLLRRNG